MTCKQPIYGKTITAKTTRNAELQLNEIEVYANASLPPPKPQTKFQILHKERDCDV